MLVVVVKEPLKDPEIREIPNTLKSWQDIVGGYVASTRFGPFCIMHNEDGRTEGLEPNIQYYGAPVHGTVFISKESNNGNLVSLNATELINALVYLKSNAL